ncbi:hypothetical protein ACHAWT_010240 [Skeletonema menzelii]
MNMMKSSRRIAYIASLAILSARGCGGEENDRNLGEQSPPPKLSFTAEEAQSGIKNDDTNNAQSWTTVFQGVSDKSTAENVMLRSAPLLTLFPSGGGSFGDSNSEYHARHMVLDPAEQRSYLVGKGSDCHANNVVERFDQFQSASLNNLATELWKYCALYLEGGVYVDSETAPLVALGDLLKPSDNNNNNYAVVVDSVDAAVSPQFWPSSAANGAIQDGNVITSDHNIASSGMGGNKIVSGSFIAIQTKLHSVPKAVVDTIMATSIIVLEQDALLLPKSLMNAIQIDANKGTNSWTFLSQRCHGIKTAAGDIGDENDVNQSQQHRRSLRHCPSTSGYCCEILDPDHSFVFLLSRHPLVPNQVLPHPMSLPQPYAKTIATDIELDPKTQSELPFISTLRDDKSSPLLTLPFQSGSTEITPNVYDLLHAREALPNQEDYPRQCMDCLRIKGGATCKTCRDLCPTFCENLCEVKLKEKPVKNVLNITAPRFRKDPERIIPRIIHQTWFEPVTAEKYPNMYRLIESWKRSGWEYIFYDDDAAGEFLSLHFPPEVKDAYDSVTPGAFKADLFRYCALLIKGGIYADMDIMLESNLDAAVPPDVGFMVPRDEPGIKPGHQMCLWNGMIAAAPAHPYLARVIDRVVHNIRNRFTVVDYDHIMCKNPELSLPHAYSTLFTGGPCILGMTLNEVMGRPLQQTFEYGDLVTNVELPGRTVILNQNKWDMGGHRFTWVDNNLIVAATDMPDYDDRQELKGGDKNQAKHYSKALDRTTLYGYKKVYTDRQIAHERIVFQLQSDLDAGSTA